MAKMSPEAKESKKMQYRRTVKRKQEQEHDIKMAMIKWFTDNDEAPYIAMLIAGGGMGVLSRLFSEFIKLGTVRGPVTDAELRSLGYTDDEIVILRNGGFVLRQTEPHPITGEVMPLFITLDLLYRAKNTNRDPTQLDDVMGTLGGGLAGFAGSVLFLKAIFGKEGARGSGSVLAAAAVVGMGTTATAAIVGKLADDF